MQRSQKVLLTHGDSIDRVGSKLKVGAYSSNRIVAAVYNEQLRIYGVQFHPEVAIFVCVKRIMETRSTRSSCTLNATLLFTQVDLTVNGKQMLSNFLMDIAGMQPNFTMRNREEECIAYIREHVGNSKVLVSIARVSWKHLSITFH